jgi:hypothetical protein
MTTIPSGDAMTVRYTQIPKRKAVRRPISWRIHPDDIAQFTADREHCETRRCHRPAAIITWRFWWSTEIGRMLLAEHLACEQHGREFADRHHIEISPAPDDPPGTGRLSTDLLRLLQRHLTGDNPGGAFRI